MCCKGGKFSNILLKSHHCRLFLATTEAKDIVDVDGANGHNGADKRRYFSSFSSECRNLQDLLSAYADRRQNQCQCFNNRLSRLRLLRRNRPRRLAGFEKKTHSKRGLGCCSGFFRVDHRANHPGPWSRFTKMNLLRGGSLFPWFVLQTCFSTNLSHGGPSQRRFLTSFSPKHLLT